jgi:ATP-dependent DNA helicase RecG
LTVDVDLDAPVASLKGVGTVRRAALKKLNIESLSDLLRHYPRDYEDRRKACRIAELSGETTALVQAEVVSVEKGAAGRGAGKRPLKLLVRDGTGTLEIVFFHAGYLAKAFSPGDAFVFYGKVTADGRVPRMIHPDFRRAGEDGGREILPIYPLVSGLSQKDLRRWTEELIARIQGMDEYLPGETVRRNRLCGPAYALENIHYPGDRQRLREAKYRLVFEELLCLQTGLLLLKNARKQEGGCIRFKGKSDVDDFVSGLPYELTGAQRRALSEISADMEAGRVMNRLLQGDVGSGKTVVAAAAMYKAVKSGCQALMMAPTETLARQHFDEFGRLFARRGLRLGFLSGAVRGGERRELIERLERNEIDVLIGTHALIQPDVVCGRLGLVVTDEQHRFGVNQRVRLSRKGENPDVLVMTATPIPRTLALILYGDLDISVIDERPPGRRPVLTRAVGAEGRAGAYEQVRREIRNGGQAYVVTPLIEDSEDLELRSATGVYEELVKRFAGFSVDLIHGQMRQAEKDAAMSRFYGGGTDILVSTVLIEVGINVPNATVMLIENAERFGLAQLHQLRGRVGRGARQSCCILITEGDSKEAAERARVMTSTDDGFVIAEKDLELRGPGEFFGLRQHGVPELRAADLIRHVKVLKTVRDEAERLLSRDPLLEAPENLGLKRQVEGFFRKAADVGM